MLASVKQTKLIPSFDVLTLQISFETIKAKPQWVLSARSDCDWCSRFSGVLDFRHSLQSNLHYHRPLCTIYAIYGYQRAPCLDGCARFCTHLNPLPPPSIFFKYIIKQEEKWQPFGWTGHRSILMHCSGTNICVCVCECVFLILFIIYIYFTVNKNICANLIQTRKLSHCLDTSYLYIILSSDRVGSSDHL